MDILSLLKQKHEKTTMYKELSVPKTYRLRTSFPTDLVFVYSGNTYLRVAANSSKYLYEVTTDGGNTYYEVFERNHLYRENPNFKSGNIESGEEMYPRDEDFGSWAWCVSTPERAVRCFTWDSVNKRRLSECDLYDITIGNTNN